MENNLYDTRGGNRSGSGRKKLPDVKAQVYAMVRESIIALIGEDEVKRMMTEAIKWNGQKDDLKIELNADMKIARLIYQDNPVELVEIMWESGKAYVIHAGRRLYISQFGKIIQT